jgi:hypothetical protein
MECEGRNKSSCFYERERKEKSGERNIGVATMEESQPENKGYTEPRDG